MRKITNHNLLEEFGLTESDVARMGEAGMTEDEIVQILHESASCSSHTRMSRDKFRHDKPAQVIDTAEAYVFGRYGDGF